MSEDTKSQNESESVEELPDWAREQLSKANSQAAKYRTERNEALKTAKEQVSEEFNSRIAELEAELEGSREETGQAKRAVDRLHAALEAGIAADKVCSFADLLKGDSPDELRSHAEELKGLFSVESPKKQGAVDPSQGAKSNLPLNGDALLEAVISKVGR